VIFQEVALTFNHYITELFIGGTGDTLVHPAVEEAVDAYIEGFVSPLPLSQLRPP
jgi:hypothetical protein